MHPRHSTACALAACLLAWASSGLAEQPGSSPAVRMIDVSVNYSFVQPLGNEQGDALKSLQEAGRRAAYEIAARECSLLLATIASSCSLERINVNSNQQRNGVQDQIIINANANFRIEPKTK